MILALSLSTEARCEAFTGTYDCQTGQPTVTTAVSTPDPERVPAGRTFAANRASTDWLNSAGKIIQNSYWTTRPTNYFAADNFNLFIFQSKTCSRDLEVDTWIRNGYVLLRYEETTGKGVFFRLNLEVAGGQLDVGIVTGAGEEQFLEGDYYTLYHSADLVHVAPGYKSNPSNGQYFTFGVEGFDIYAKFNGVEFIRFKEYREMASGRFAIKANRDYGIRRTTLRHKVASGLFSNYQNNFLDLRDFGIRDIKGRASISAGSNQLTLSSSSPFTKGDFIIVEIGGEDGRGLRGTVGVGGSWPWKKYRSVGEMKSDTGQPNGTFAWLVADGSVWQWDQGAWIQRPALQYYTNTVFPLSLRARIVGVSADGQTLTLDRTAAVSADDAEVYLDNYYVFFKLLRNPVNDGEMNFPAITDSNDLTSITPTDVTLILPAGNYAIGDTITWQSPPGWKLIGQGQNASKIFSPKGVKSASINIHSRGVQVRDFTLEGNARDHGFGLNVSETDVPQGSAFPAGVTFIGTEDGLAENLAVTDVFQRAVGASFSRNIRGKHITVKMSDGLRQYVQWMLQWADSQGGGCEDCHVESPKLLGGFESFKSTGTQFIRPVGINATFALNDAGNFLVEGGTVRLLAGSNHDNKSFSVHNPIVSISTNIGNRYASAGGMIRNMTMIQEGFVGDITDPNHDSLIGIIVNANNPNITIIGGLYSAPDYTPPSGMFGPLAINSTGRNTLIDGIRVIGKPAPDRGNISITDGVVRNCTAGKIIAAGPSPSVRIENCKADTSYEQK